MATFDEESRRWAYDKLSEENQMGTYDEFKAGMADEESRKWAFDKLSEKYDMGSLDEFTDAVYEKPQGDISSSGEPSSHGGAADVNMSYSLTDNAVVDGDKLDVPISPVGMANPSDVLAGRVTNQNGASYVMGVPEPKTKTTMPAEGEHNSGMVKNPENGYVYSYYGNKRFKLDDASQLEGYYTLPISYRENIKEEEEAKSKTELVKEQIAEEQRRRNSDMPSSSITQGMYDASKSDPNFYVPSADEVRNKAYMNRTWLSDDAKLRLLSEGVSLEKQSQLKIPGMDTFGEVKDIVVGEWFNSDTGTNFDQNLAEYCKTAVESQYGRAQDAYDANLEKNKMAGGVYALNAARGAYAKELSIEEATQLAKQYAENAIYNPELQDKIAVLASRLGVGYEEMLTYIADAESKRIEQYVTREYAKREAPKSRGQYIMQGAIYNSVINGLARQFAGTNELEQFREQMWQMASTGDLKKVLGLTNKDGIFQVAESEKFFGTSWTDLSSTALGFILDTPFFKAAGLAARAMTMGEMRLLMRGQIENLAKTYRIGGMATEEAYSKAFSTILRRLDEAKVTNLFKEGKILRAALAKDVAMSTFMHLGQSAQMMGTFNAISSVAQGTDVEEGVEEGLISGGLLGFASKITKVPETTKGWRKLGNHLKALVAEDMAFAAPGIFDAAITAEDFEDFGKKAVKSIVDSTLQLGAIKLSGLHNIFGAIKNWNKGMRIEQYEQLQNDPYCQRFYETIDKIRYAKDESKVSEYTKELKEAYADIMRNADIDHIIKLQMAMVMKGKLPLNFIPAVSEVRRDGNEVVTYDNEGKRITTRRYKNEAEAIKAEDRMNLSADMQKIDARTMATIVDEIVSESDGGITERDVRKSVKKMLQGKDKASDQKNISLVSDKIAQYLDIAEGRGDGDKYGIVKGHYITLDGKRYRVEGYAEANEFDPNYEPTVALSEMEKDGNRKLVFAKASAIRAEKVKADTELLQQKARKSIAGGDNNMAKEARLKRATAERKLRGLQTIVGDRLIGGDGRVSEDKVAMLASDPYSTDGSREAAQEWLDANEQMKGVEDRIETQMKDVDKKNREAVAFMEYRGVSGTDSTGKVLSGKCNGTDVFIIKGDMRGDYLTVCDEDGSNLRVVKKDTLTEVKNAQLEGIVQMNNTKMRMNIAGYEYSQIIGSVNVGDEIAINDKGERGKILEIRGEKVNGMATGRATVVYGINGEQKEMPMSEVLRIKENNDIQAYEAEQERRVAEQKAEAEKREDARYKLGKGNQVTLKDDNGEFTVTIDSIDKENGMVSLIDESGAKIDMPIDEYKKCYENKVGTAPEVVVTGGAKETPKEEPKKNKKVIPTDGNGYVLSNETTPSEVFGAIEEQFPGNAEAVADSYLADLEQQLEGAKTVQLGGDPMERARINSEHSARRKFIEEQIAFWNGVKQERNKRVATAAIDAPMDYVEAMSKNGGLNRTEMAEKIRLEDPEFYNTINNIAKGMHVNIMFEQSEEDILEGNNGMYDAKTNTIHVAYESADITPEQKAKIVSQVLRATFGHEFGHFLMDKKNTGISDAEDAKFRKKMLGLVKGYLGKELYEKQYAKENKHKQANTEEEVMANTIGQLFLDQKFIDMLMGSEEMKEKSFAEKMRDNFKGFMLKVKTLFGGDEEAYREWKQEHNADEILRLLNKAYERAESRVESREYRDESREYRDESLEAREDIMSADGKKMSVRTKDDPEETKKVYKLMRLMPDGNLQTLYIGRETYKLGQWYDADSPNMDDLKGLEQDYYYLFDENNNVIDKKPIKYGKNNKVQGLSKSEVLKANDNGHRWMAVGRYADGSRRYANMGINGAEGVMDYALRPGIHAGSLPSMMQIGSGTKEEKASNGGQPLRDDDLVWVEGSIAYGNGAPEEALANHGEINDHVPVDGGYEKGTSSFVTKGMSWYISGAFRPERIISDSEARAIIDDFNKNIKDADAPDVPYDYNRRGGRMFNAETMQLEDAKMSTRKEAEVERMVKEEGLYEGLARDLAKYNLTVSGGVTMDSESYNLKKQSGYKTPMELSDGNDGVKYSYRTKGDWMRSFVNGKSKLSKARREEIARVVDSWYEQAAMDDIMKDFLSYGAYIKDMNKDGVGPLRGNVEYMLTFDLDTSCPRTFAYLNYADVIEGALKRPLSITESQQLIETMRAYGQMIPCTYCYAENKRQAFKNYALSFMAHRNDVLTATSEEDAFNKMYGVTEKTNKETGEKYKEMSKAAKKTFDRWRSGEGLSSWNPTIEQLSTLYRQARNVVLTDLDNLKREGKVHEHMKEESMVNMLCDMYGIERGDEANGEDKGKATSISNIVNEWRYDEVEGKKHRNYQKVSGMVKGRQDALALWDEMSKYCASASSAHNSVKYFPYTDQLRSDKALKYKDYINGMGGLRMHSTNDFRIDYVGDYFQLIADMARDGWMGHTYTKSPEFVRIFGNTGYRINMSLAAYTIKDASGKKHVVMNAEEGNDWETAKELRSQFKNAGTMFMTTDSLQLDYAMNADWIDMIIPFHSSGLPKEVMSMRAWEDAQSKQNEQFYNNAYMKAMLIADGEKVTSSTSKERIQKMFDKKYGIKRVFDNTKNMKDELKEAGVSIPAKSTYADISKLYKDAFGHKCKAKGSMVKPHFLPGETMVGRNKIPGHNNDVARYLELCRQYGVHPRFHGLTVDDGTGKRVPIEEHNNYIKVIKETARTDSEQENVKFNLDEPNEYYDRLMGTGIDENTGKSHTAMDYAMWELRNFALKNGYKQYEEDPHGIVKDFMDNFIDYEKDTGEQRPLDWVSPEARWSWHYQNQAMNEIDRDAYRERLAGIYGDEEAMLSLSTPYQPGVGEQKFSQRIEKSDPFYSNAAKAVEGIKQDKATPEQWLKMIEKAGGLKKEEDKWMGLSEWLNKQKAMSVVGERPKTVTRQEVMDFIAENSVKVEEVNYAETPDANENAELGGFIPENQEMHDQGFVTLEYPLDVMKVVRRYNELHDRKIDANTANELTTDDWDILDGWKDELESKLGDNWNTPNETRLSYTTEGLTNKREIALTVPTIDPYDAYDIVHFGDADDGRAVAWVRFGDATEKSPERLEFERIMADNEEFTQREENRIWFKYRVNGPEGIKQEWTRRKQLQVDALKKAEVSTGNKVLVVDEVQSKRHQDGLKDGYDADRVKPEDLIARKREAGEKLDAYRAMLEEKYGRAYHKKRTPEEKAEENRLREEWSILSYELLKYEKGSGVPDAPFRKNWHELAMKRMLRYAAENGYDKIAWTTGMQQAERYNLGGKVDFMQKGNDYGQNEDTYFISVNGKVGDVEVFEDGIVTGASSMFSQAIGKPFSELVGKELAERLVSTTPGKKGRIQGEGLSIGGSGMKGFYDKMLPNFMSKYGKKWGAKVGEVTLDLPNESDRVMWSMDITPEMKESVMQGQPMFSTRKFDESKLKAKEGEVKIGKWGNATFKSLYKGVVGSDQLAYPKVSFSVLSGENTEPYFTTSKSLEYVVFAHLPKDCFVMDGNDFVSINMDMADKYLRPYIIDGIEHTINKYEGKKFSTRNDVEREVSAFLDPDKLNIPEYGKRKSHESMNDKLNGMGIANMDDVERSERAIEKGLSGAFRTYYDGYDFMEHEGVPEVVKDAFANAEYDYKEIPSELNRLLKDAMEEGDSTAEIEKGLFWYNSHKDGLTIAPDEFFDNDGKYVGADGINHPMFSTRKEEQLDIIRNANPKDESLSDHTWIESVDDIKTFSEAVKDEWVGTPDFTLTDAEKALKSGKVKVYSSYPITDGVFVTPSKMEAKNYAGDGKVYEKVMNIDDVAWIDSNQGQVAEVKDDNEGEYYSVKYSPREKGEPITIENYYYDTEVNFKKLGEDMPYYKVWQKWFDMKKEPGMEYHKSPKSQSQYLINRHTGDIYRLSDHWGNVASCIWNIDSENTKGKGENGRPLTIAVANIEDFKDLNTKFSVRGEKGAKALDIVDGGNRMENLEVAKRMKEEGVSALKIKKATGWELGVDNKWRLESEKDGSFYNYSELRGWKNQYDSAPLYTIWKDSELFEAYPGLENVKVYKTPKGSDYEGSFNGAYFELNTKQSEESARMTLIHEIQHYIQRQEGFARGGSEGMSFENTKELATQQDAEAAKISKSVAKKYPHVTAFGDWGSTVSLESDYKGLQKTLEALGTYKELISKYPEFFDGLSPKEVRSYMSAYDNSRSKMRQRISELYPDVNPWDHEISRELSRIDSNVYHIDENPVSIADADRMMDYVSSAIDKVNSFEKKWNNKWKKIGFDGFRSGGRISFDDYMRLAGEVESRNVEARADMTGSQRRNKLLSSTEGVSRKEQIIRYAGDGNAYTANNQPKFSTRDDIHTDNFKKWFGDWEKDPEHASKVVDEKGEPLVVYHGTMGQPQDMFNIFESGMFASNENVSKYFNGDEFERPGKTYKVFLNIQKPLVINADKHVWNDIPISEELATKLGIKSTFNLHKKEDGNIFVTTDDIVNALRENENGYDGVIIKDVYETDYGDVLTDDFAVLSPTQIKSATDNNGEYDGGNPDIRYATRKDDVDIARDRLMKKAYEPIVEKMKEVSGGNAWTYAVLKDDKGNVTLSSMKGALMRNGIQEDVAESWARQAMTAGFVPPTRDEVNALAQKITARKQQKQHGEFVEDARKRVEDKIKELIDNKNITVMQKSQLNALMRQIRYANANNVGDIINNVERVVNNLETKVLGKQLGNLLSMKVQDVNGRNQSIAKNVDNTTRMVMEDIKTKMFGVGYTDADEAMHNVRSENWHLRDENVHLRGELEHGMHGAEGSYDYQQTLDKIAENDAKIEANKQRLVELKAQKKSLVAESRMKTAEQCKAELEELEQKNTDAADPESNVTWTQEDTARETGLQILQKCLELDALDEQIADLYDEKRENAKDANERRAYDTQISMLEKDRLAKMRDIVNTIQDVVDGGKMSLAMQNEAKREHQRKIISGALSDIGGNRGNRPSYDPHKEEHKNQNKVVEWVNKVIHAGNSPLKTFAYMCEMMDKNHMSGDGFMTQYFLKGKNGVMEANNAYLRGFKEASDILNAKTKDIFGKDMLHVAADGKKTSENHGITLVDSDYDAEGNIVTYGRKPLDHKGSGKPIPLSKNEATYLYMVWQMPDGRAKMENEGFDEQSIQEIAEYIGQERVDWANYVQREYLPSRFPKYNQKYMEIFGTPMRQNENYVPLRYEEGALKTGEEETMTNGGNTSNKLSAKSGFTINRVMNLLPVSKTTDAFDVIVDHVRQAEEMAAYADVRRDLDILLGSKAFKNQMERNGQWDFKDFVEACKVATKNYDSKKQPWDTLLNSITKGLVGANIAFRVGTAIKQMTSVPAFMSYSNNPLYQAQLLKNLVKQYTLNFPGVVGGAVAKKSMLDAVDNGTWVGLTKDFKWAMDNIPSFRNRLSVGDMGNEILQMDGKTFRSKVMQHGMYANQMIDAVTCLVGIKSVYDFNMNKAKKAIEKDYQEGKITAEQRDARLQEAHRVACMEADTCYNSSQQSSNEAYLAPIQASGNFLAKALMAYKNSPVSYARHAILAVKDLNKGLMNYKKTVDSYVKTYELTGISHEEAVKEAKTRVSRNIWRSINRLSMYGLVLGAIWQVAGNGIYGMYMDDEQKEELLSVGTIMKSLSGGGLPLWDIASGIASGDGYDFMLASAELKQIIQTYNSLKDDIEENPYWGYYDAAITTMQKLSRFYGADLQTIGNVFLGVEEMIRQGMSGEEIDAMLNTDYIINLAKSNRKSSTLQLYADKSEEELAETLAKAMGYYEEGDPRRYVPGAKTLDDKKRTEIKNLVLKAKGKTDEEKKEVEKAIEKMNSLDELSEMYNSLEDDKLKKKVINRMKKVDENANKPRTWAEVFKDDDEPKTESNKPSAKAKREFTKNADAEDLLEENRINVKVRKLGKIWEEAKNLQGEERASYMKEHEKDIQTYQRVKGLMKGYNNSKIRLLYRDDDAEVYKDLAKKRKDILEILK